MQVVGLMTLLLGTSFAAGQDLDDRCNPLIIPTCLYEMTQYICDRTLFNCGTCVFNLIGSDQSRCSDSQECLSGIKCQSSNPPFLPPTTLRPRTTPVTSTTTATPLPATTIIPSTTVPPTSIRPSTTSIPTTSNSNISIYIGIGCGVLILCAVFLFLWWKRRLVVEEEKELETFHKEIYVDGDLHGDPALFNTIGHQSMIVSARSEPDALWWAQATLAERENRTTTPKITSEVAV